MQVKRVEQSNHSAIRFAYDDAGREIGHAYLYFIKNDLHNQPYGYLEDVFVEEARRGEGTGTRLMQAAIAESRARGCYKIIGTSRHGRDGVHAWYEKLGFTDFGVEFRMNLE